jgi:hypothetical protein
MREPKVFDPELKPILIQSDISNKDLLHEIAKSIIGTTDSSVNEGSYWKRSEQRLLERLLLLVLLLTTLIIPVSAQNIWEPAKNLVAGSTESRMKVLRKYKLDKGEFIIGLMSIKCEMCEEVAKEIDKVATDNRPMAIFVIAPEKDLKDWKEKLQLKQIQVISVPEEELTYLGAVILPTLVKVKDGKYIAAMEARRGAKI